MDPSIPVPQHIENVASNSAADHTTPMHHQDLEPTPDANHLSPTIAPITPSVSEDITVKSVAPSKFSRWITDWIVDWWGIELVCWTVSALSLLAIVVFLESYKNKPLPEWPFKLTINSFVSIFATISQMAMLNPVVECISQLKWLFFIRKERLSDFQALDGASRGPTGSLMLLGRLRGLHLVSLGAAITVLSTAFGAFTQQVVTSPLRLHPTQNASTPLVINLIGPNNLDLGTYDPSLVAPIYNALSGNAPNLREITPSCGTGDCTWNAYTSLGVCPSVVDLSSSITKNACNQSELDGFILEAGPKNPGYPCYNYTLPFITENSVLISGGYIGNVSLSNVVPVPRAGIGGEIQTLTMTSDPTPYIRRLSGFEIYGGWLLYQPDIEASINASLTSPVAYGLSLGLCLQTYNTTVSNGITETSLISSSELSHADFPKDANIQNTTVVFNAAGSIINATNDPSAAISSGLKYSVNLYGMITLHESYVNVLFDNCFHSVFNTTDNFGDTYCAGDGFGISFLNALNSSTDPFSAVDELMENIATSTTNVLRSGAGGFTHTIPFIGTAFSQQPTVGTDYTWLIFPLALVSLTLVFLLATITKSQRLGSRVWKSSNIATLQGLHLDLHTSLGGLSSISEMDEKAKSIEVRFDMEGGKAEHGVEYRLVESKQDTYWKG